MRQGGCRAIPGQDERVQRRGRRAARAMIARIHVNQHRIRSNHKHGLSEPVITIKRGGRTITCNRVEVAGPCTVVYSPTKPLSCGARVWIETKAPLIVDGGRDEQEENCEV